MNTIHPSGNTSFTFFETLEKAYFDQATGYYLEELGSPEPAFNWPLGVLLTAFNGLARLDRGFILKLEQTLTMATSYWNPAGPVPGFDVLPGPRKSVDRYYDDNAWMVMALVEAFEITGNQEWLDWARKALEYVLSGYDDALGGGIYWRECDKASKNTCSNGPSAAACLAVYEHTKEDRLVTMARKLYEWTKTTFQDPTDSLFFDNLNLAGELEQTKWSYNSALMIRTARVLGFEQDAERISTAATERWVKEDGSIDDEMPFAHLLFENLEPLSFDWQNCIELLTAVSEQGCPARWKAGNPSPKLIQQASALRAMTVAGLWSKG